MCLQWQQLISAIFALFSGDDATKCDRDIWSMHCGIVFAWIYVYFWCKEIKMEWLNESMAQIYLLFNIIITIICLIHFTRTFRWREIFAWSLNTLSLDYAEILLKLCIIRRVMCKEKFINNSSSISFHKHNNPVCFCCAFPVCSFAYIVENYFEKNLLVFSCSIKTEINEELPWRVMPFLHKLEVKKVEKSLIFFPNYWKTYNNFDGTHKCETCSST